MVNHYRPLCSQNERLVRLCSCVVKSPSMENQTDIINKHSVHDANHDESAVYHENGCNDPDDDNDDTEKDVYCNFLINDEECGDAGDDAADEDVHDQDANGHGNNEECDASDDAVDEDVHDQDANGHGNNGECDEANDDLEKDRFDENANYNGVDEKCDATISDYAKELDQFELVNNDHC